MEEEKREGTGQPRSIWLIAVLVVSISTSMFDVLERLLSEMTYVCVSGVRADSP